MASHPSAIQMANENRLKGLLQKSGYENAVKLTDSLQGSIWRAMNKTTKDSVVIKATQKNLHQHGIVIINGMPVDVEEDIIKETAILKYLTEFEFESESEQNHDKQTKKAIPNSFVKYIDSFQTYAIYIFIHLNSELYLCLYPKSTRTLQFIVHNYSKPVPSILTIIC